MTPLAPHDGAPGFRIEFRHSNDIAWVVLQGEADVSTLELLEAALEHTELTGTTSIHLQVSELDFADAATVRRLTVFAKRARQSGRDIKTCGANPTFRLLARVLDARDALGLL